MENLNLVDAFAKFGGKTASRLHALSAIAADGAMILRCATPYFAHPAPGVLRYEDRLSREAEHPQGPLLSQHLTLARDGDLPIRMVVINHQVPAAGGKTSRSIHVRADLIGKLTKFDGDHFIVDFTRAQEPRVAAGRRK
jgi:hypothetical protein